MKSLFLKARENLWVLISIVSLLTLIVFSGVADSTEPAPADDIDDLNELLDKFESAYSNKQLNDLRQLFYADAVIAYDFDMGESQRVHCLEDWLQGTQESTFDTNEYISDSLTNREIQVFRNIAYAVCDYTYIDDEDIGRGIDIFTFMKTRDRWKILSLQFTGDQDSSN